jgi:hypothetical protein
MKLLSETNAPSMPKRRAWCLGARQAIVELDVLRVCRSRGAGRPTMDPCRRNRIPEVAIGLLITREDAGPSRVIRDRQVHLLPELKGRCGHRFSSLHDTGDVATRFPRAHSSPCLTPCPSPIERCEKELAPSAHIGLMHAANGVIRSPCWRVRGACATRLMLARRVGPWPASSPRSQSPR